MLGAFQNVVTDVNNEYPIINELVFAGLMVGAMLPYYFSALTVQSVGTAALEMVEELCNLFFILFYFIFELNFFFKPKITYNRGTHTVT